MVTTNLHPDCLQSIRPKAASTAALLLLCFLFHAQPYDLVIQNGHLIDPKHGINTPMDVAIHDGHIAALHPSIPAEHAIQTIAATDLYIAPRLIDMHVHVFHGTTPDAYLRNSFERLPPDGFTFRSGATTVVDAGCAGWRYFETFKKQTIDRAATRVLAFLNIVGGGMAGGAAEQNVDDMNPISTASMAKKYEDIIVGIKLAHFEGPDWTPLNRTVKAGEKAGMPVMIDFGIDLQNVIAATTVSPAQTPGRPDLGHLGVGAVADVVIFDIEEGAFGFVDTKGHRIDGGRKLRCEMTIRAGTVVWDLNGLASNPWQSR